MVKTVLGIHIIFLNVSYAPTADSDVQRYYEKCLDVSETQQLIFNFNSQAPFSFNLHYHDEGEVYYEIKEDSVAVFDFTFKPEKRAYYCLMWGNTGAEKVEMKYELIIQNRSSN
ncbi:hypothetical protein OAK48_03155 [Deltaproteobacteria bacterium]|nr:hypothetical protein [Deltaproteobacteria bacterium]